METGLKYASKQSLHKFSMYLVEEAEAEGASVFVFFSHTTNSLGYKITEIDQTDDDHKYLKLA